MNHLINLDEAAQQILRKVITTKASKKYDVFQKKNAKLIPCLLSILSNFNQPEIKSDTLTESHSADFLEGTPFHV